MKINLILLVLMSLFFTVLGSFGVGCHDNEETCKKDKRHPAILTCKSGLWDYKEMCGENHYCDLGPPVTCKEKQANARSFDDADSANDGDSSNDAPSSTVTTSAATCYGNEEKCNPDKEHPTIIMCTSGTPYVQTCSPDDFCDSGPPVACKKRSLTSTFDYTPSATDPCAPNDAASPTHAASHTRPASPTNTDSSSDSSSDSECSDSSDDEAA